MEISDGEKQLSDGEAELTKGKRAEIAKYACRREERAEGQFLCSRS